MQEGQASVQERLSAVQDELACERKAKEVLAFALGRVLRETQGFVPGEEQRNAAGASAGGVDELQDQLHRMSVQESPAADVRAAVVEHTVAAAHRILEMPAAEFSSSAPWPPSHANSSCQLHAALQSTDTESGDVVFAGLIEAALVPVLRSGRGLLAGFASVSPERQARPARTYRGWFDSACLDSRVLRFAPSDVSPLAATPLHSTACCAMQHVPLSQPPDTSSLFPGAACSTQGPAAAPQLPAAAPSAPAVADPARPSSPGVQPEASFNFGMVGTCVTPVGASGMLAQPSAEEVAAGELHEASSAEKRMPSERAPGGSIPGRSPSPSNPMCTPSSAGTSCCGREPDETQPPGPAGCSSGDVCEQPALAGPDMSPLAAWKTGHAAGSTAPLVVPSSAASDPRPLVVQISSQRWLEDVIQPTGEPCSLALGQEPPLLEPQNGVAPVQRLAISPASEVPGAAPEPVKRKRESRESVQACSHEAPLCQAEAPKSAMRDDAVEAGNTAPQWHDRPQWPGIEGPRPMFSSNSPELVDRYKDSGAGAAAGFRVPGAHPQPGTGGDANGVDPVGRKLVMSGLQPSDGGPFSVLPRSGVQERLLEQQCDTRPPTETEEAEAAAAGTPAGPQAGLRSLQWLAALEGQVAPKSFNSQFGATVMRHSVGTATPQPHVASQAGESQTILGTVRKQRQGDLEHAGMLFDLEARPRAVQGEGRGKSQAPPAEARRASQPDRCDEWLKQQLHRDGDSAGRSHRHSGGLNALAVECGAEPGSPKLSDSDSDGAGTASEDGSAGGASGSPVPSHPNSSMHEPFAWRGKLPGATARAAALEIRHFCAMSQQSDGSRVQHSGSSHVKGKVHTERQKPAARRKKPKSRLIVPHSPDLATARRVHGGMGNAETGKAELLTESKEYARWVTNAGRKRATVLAGHFRGSYAQRAAAWGRLRKAGAEVGYATLAKQRNKAARRDGIERSP